MTIIALPGALAAADQPALVSISPGSAREVWAERRRALERSGRSSSPDGHHGSWQGRALHLAGHDGSCHAAASQRSATVFAWPARLTGTHARGRRNALSPVLVEREFTF